MKIGADAISAIISVYSIIESYVTEKISGSKEEKALLRELLEESYLNIKLLKEDYLIYGNDVITILNALKINKLEKAEAMSKRGKLNFNKLTVVKKVNKKCTNQLPIYLKEKYLDADIERLFLKIREKISELKTLKKTRYKRGKWYNINPTYRMNTIKELYLLLDCHLFENKLIK
jgi:hypothetical protein